MLSKLKDNISGKRTDELAAEVADTKKLHQEHADIISAVKQEISQLKTSITDLTVTNTAMGEANSMALDESTKLREQLQESISSIKVLSSTVQNTLSKRITDEINALTQEITSKLGGAEKLKNELSESTQTVNTGLKDLTKEISRIQAITSNIKASDFELTKHANRLTADDAEKLKLTRQIDSLQRLVSSLRRRS